MSDTMIYQQRALRKRRLMEIYITGEENNGVYCGIDTNIEEYPVEDLLVDNTERYQAMAELQMQLRSFGDEQVIDLLNWSYALTDAAIRGCYCSSLLGAPTLPGDRLKRPNKTDITCISQNINMTVLFRKRC